MTVKQGSGDRADEEPRQGDCERDNPGKER